MKRGVDSMLPIQYRHELPLGLFHYAPYSLQVKYSNIDGVQVTVTKNGKLQKNVRLIAPFADLPRIPPHQLRQRAIRLSSLLATQYTIHLKMTVSNILQVEFIPKLLGGGSCSSKSAAEDVDEKKSHRPSNSDNDFKEEDVSITLEELSLHPTANANSEDLSYVIRNKFIENLPEIKNLLTTYIPPSCSNTCSFDAPMSLEKSIVNFLKSDQKVFLLLGNAGAGKTTFGKYLTYKIWRDWKLGKLIPLFIPLGVVDNATENLIEKTLHNYGLSDAQIVQLRKEKSFLFILDGYDEMDRKFNAYDTYQLQNWNCKVIISCRSQNISQDHGSLFAPHENFIPQRSLLRDMWVVPFTEKEIDTYLKKYVELTPGAFWDTYEQYQEQMKAIPGLYDLISTPFLLYITAETLPAIVKQRSELEGNNKTILVQCDLYDAFIKQWFERAEMKLRDGHRLDNFHGDIKKEFLNFCTRLASKMHEKNMTFVKYTPPVWGAEENEWEQFFGKKDPLPQIRDGIPIYKVADNTYAFLHKSILEYFIYRDGMDQVTDKVAFLGQINSSDDDEKSHQLIPQPTVKKNLQLNLTLRLLNEATGVVEFYRDSILKDPSKEEFFFDIIQGSKTDPTLAIPAANSMTILNAAKVNLSNRNFQGVQIPGANLSGAILTSTNLSHSDLTNVYLEGAVLDYATISHSKVQGVELGQRPFIKTSNSVRMSVSPDGKYLLVGNKTNAQIIDSRTGKKIYRSESFKYIDKIAFSSDSSKFVTLDEKNVILHDFKAEASVAYLERNLDCSRYSPYYPHSIAFSHSGRLVIGCHGDSIYLWDCLREIEVKRLKHTHSVDCAIFSFQDKWIVSSDFHIIRLWDYKKWKEIRQFEGHTGSVVDLACSLDGKMIVSASSDNTARLWDLETGKEIHCFEGHTREVSTVAFSPDGKWIASGSQDKSVRLWDCLTGNEIHRFEGHIDDVHTVVFSPDGKWLYSLGEGIKMWNLQFTTKNSKERKNFPDHNLLLLSSSGKLISASLYEKTVRIWDSKTGNEISRIFTNAECIACTPNNEVITSLGEMLFLWDIQTGKEIRRFKGHTKPISSIAVFSNNKQMVSSSWDHTIRLWDYQSGKIIRSFELAENIGYKVALSSDSTMMVSGGYNYNTIHLWNCQSGNIIRYLNGGNSVRYVAFSPDGKLVISGNDDSTNFWDCQTGELIDSFPERTDEVAFSPNGQWAVYTSGRKLILKYYVKDVSFEKFRFNQEKIIFERDFRYYIKKVVFCPNGKEIVLITDQPSLQKWSLFDENDHLCPTLIWTNGASTLSAHQLDINGVQGLSDSNQRLLQQNGSNDEKETEDD